MKSVIANSPSYGAIVVGRLGTLTFDAGVHDMVTANGAVIDMDVPGPKSNSTPFFDLKYFVLDNCSSS